MYSSNFQPESSLRWKRIQSVLQSINADAVLLNTNANLYYSSGRVFNGYTYIPSEGEAIYFVRRPIGLKGENVHYIHKPEQIPALLTEIGLPLPRKLAIEWDASHGDFTRLSAVFPDAEITNGSAVMRKVRSVKTDYELGLLHESAVKHAEVYHRIESVYHNGMTDIELQIEIERLLRLHGNLGLFRINGQSMEIFMGNVICGDNADTPTPYDFAMGGAGLSCSIPVGCNGSLIRPGMAVMIDMCGNFTGYMTDMTRVYSVGELPDLAHRAHQCSIDIHRAVSQMGKPSVKAADLYNLAISIAKEAGLENYFMGHTQKAGFIGHGVGIEVNEAPVLAPRSKDILEGNEKLMLEEKIDFKKCDEVGTILYVAIDKKYVGYVLIADKIKQDSSKTIRELKAMNIKETVMLTGDKKEVGEYVAKKLNMDKVYTELLPDGKVEKVEELLKQKSEKGKLVFVGDGINDAPVLTISDIGVAMGGLGSDAAIEAADIVIMTDETSKISKAINLSKKTMRIVRENIIFAIFVKIAVLVLTAFGASTMWEAVFADVGVSVIAIINALRMLNIKKFE